ncbi:hypothetical protein TWF173_009122 [Orbilia oligospora]|uniref:Uncharacterized protein n=1 Tax=Orbilia oligospora TaxID=2813651 RepID=A0A7C8R9Y2_ORBOL|nr:hypothetical protein TWF970_006121 [Orbilia oligospora]KAF3310883.1 hypothetical protein TWF173_009122 [Orbilia oligospora]
MWNESKRIHHAYKPPINCVKVSRESWFPSLNLLFDFLHPSQTLRARESDHRPSSSQRIGIESRKLSWCCYCCIGRRYDLIDLVSYRVFPCSVSAFLFKIVELSQPRRCLLAA